MSLDRQDRIDRYIRGEMPEGEMQAFERDLEKDDFLSHQYEETLLIAESIRDVAADRELMEAFRMTSEEEMKAFMKEKRSGRRFLNRASWVAAAILLVAVVTRILLLPPSKSMEGLYLMYYEPVLIKNPVNPDLELWIGAFERLYGAGIHRLGAIHRGFSSYDKKIYRNLPLWHIPIELRRRMPDLPIFCDPSHIGGKRELVAPLCQQAMDLSFDGLIVESHCNPDCAWSDASQQITPDVLDYVLNLLVIRDVNQTTENLTALRRQIDGIDEQLLELLAKRMRISKEIGVYKKEHNMPILQSPRYSEILEKRSSMGEQMDLSPDFVKEILKEIHEESVRQQMIIMNEQ